MNRVRLAGCIALLVITQGCSLSRNSLMLAEAESAARELELLDSHLTLLQDITSVDYQRQLDLFTEVVSEREQNTNAHNRMREALLLITSGHPNSDPGRGYSELKSLLLEPGELTEHERALASVVLNESEHIMILEARNAELSAAISNSQSVLNATGSSNRQSLSQAREQLEAAQQEIDVLQLELEEARAKLDGIKRIEVTSE